MYLHGVSLGRLTFACFHALRPAVIDVFVIGTSAALEPITARSATTDSTGFHEHAALWACHINAGGDGKRPRFGWCVDWRADD